MATLAPPSSDLEQPALPLGPALVIVVWANAAFYLSFTRLVSPEHPLLIPLSIVGGTAAVLLSWRLLPTARVFFDNLGLHVHLGLHLLRAPIGAAFLVLLSRGLLPAEFAMRAGVGDIIAGVLAAVVLLTPARTPWRRRLLWVFNVVGLADILLVVATAQRILFSGDARSMEAFGMAPWPMIPLFVVPLVIASHVMIFARLARPSAQV